MEQAPLIESLALNVLLPIQEKDPRRIVRFPCVFQELGRRLHLTRRATWIVLRSMRERGWIEIVPYQGVRINRDRRTEDEQRAVRTWPA